MEQPGAPLTHRDDIAEHTPALGGKLHILVVAAKKPFFVGQLEQDFVQKQVQTVVFAKGKGGKIQKSA